MSGSTTGMANALGPGVPLPGTTGQGGPPPAGGAAGGNQLAPGGAGAAPGAGPMPTSHAGVLDALQKGHGQAKAAYEQTGKALGMIDHMRKGLERLADKGDMVTSEDVIEEASKLVAHGIDPMALAGVLADMPQTGGGEALGGWVQGYAIQAAMGEQQLLVAHNVARHEMGVAAMHAMTAHDVTGLLERNNGPPPDERMDGGNQLGGGGPSPGDTSMGSAPALGQRFMN